jgi:hypothetical protein
VLVVVAEAVRERIRDVVSFRATLVTLEAAIFAAKTEFKGKVVSND